MRVVADGWPRVSRLVPVGVLSAAGIVALAGCGAGTSAAVSAATHPMSPSASHAGRSAAPAATTSPRHAASRTFVRVVSAKDHGRATVATGIVLTHVAGGPDDGHYKSTGRRVTLTLAPHATVRVLPSNGAPGGHRIAPHALPSAIAHSSANPVFAVTGPTTHVITLNELYHP